jgi:polyhydroxyalkanoate depolymerase
MPDSVMSLFPHLRTNLEALKIPVRTCLACTEMQMRTISTGFALFGNHQMMLRNMGRYLNPLLAFMGPEAVDKLLHLYYDGPHSLLEGIRNQVLAALERFHQAREGELEFLDLFTANEPNQDWTVEYDPSRVILDLPGFRLIDISSAERHALKNYTVVFAPRAGHHSNIAEKVALFLRDQGLSRMAVVEQKCAQDIPLHIDGKRHYEDFAGQVDQYRLILEHLAQLTGRPPHLVAICQPGPLLMATLILHPHLGRTFGAAGSPMHTEAERGFLTDFARMAGKQYIDIMLALFGRRIENGLPGAGRDSFDGRLQVLGFYLMGYDQHLKNLKKLLQDLKSGNHDAAERQKAFYHWYNTVHHFPAGFIRDTFKEIFIQNALIHGSLRIGNRLVGIADYPGSVPVWALGGTRDNIAPPLQATGHLPLIRSVPEKNKLSLLCDGGHMGLFRSQRVLDRYYTKIARFMLARSDKR